MAKALEEGISATTWGEKIRVVCEQGRHKFAPIYTSVGRVPGGPTRGLGELLVWREEGPRGTGGGGREQAMTDLKDHKPPVASRVPFLHRCDEE